MPGETHKEALIAATALRQQLERGHVLTAIASMPFTSALYSRLVKHVMAHAIDSTDADD